MRTSFTLVVERGLRVPFHARIHIVASVALALALLLAACSSPEGSASPAAASSQDVASTPGGAVIGDPSASVPPRSADLTEIGGVELTVVEYSVDDALAAEGGDAISGMLDDLGVEPSDVELSLAVAPGGDPTISDWHIPDASAESILAAWGASAPGDWEADDLAGVPALEGSGVDGSTAWVVAAPNRLLYVRTDDRATAEEVADLIRN